MDRQVLNSVPQSRSEEISFQNRVSDNDRSLNIKVEPLDEETRYAASDDIPETSSQSLSRDLLSHTNVDQLSSLEEAQALLFDPTHDPDDLEIDYYINQGNWVILKPVLLKFGGLKPFEYHTKAIREMESVFGNAAFDVHFYLYLLTNSPKSQRAIVQSIFHQMKPQMIPVMSPGVDMNRFSILVNFNRLNTLNSLESFQRIDHDLFDLVFSTEYDVTYLSAELLRFLSPDNAKKMVNKYCLKLMVSDDCSKLSTVTYENVDHANLNKLLRASVNLDVFYHEVEVIMCALARTLYLRKSVERASQLFDLNRMELMEFPIIKKILTSKDIGVGTSSSGNVGLVARPVSKGKHRMQPYKRKPQISI